MVRAHLYDSGGRDGDVDFGPDFSVDLGKDRLLWVDVEGRDPEKLAIAAKVLGLERSLSGRLLKATGKPGLIQYPDHFHLILEALEVPDSLASAVDSAPVRREVDVVAGKNWVLTVHDGPVEALGRVDEATEGDTRLGALDAAGFLANIADEVIAGYFGLVDDLGREIDRLDDMALRAKPRDDILGRIVRLRRLIGVIRRSLVAHRPAFAALARPEMELHEELGKPWPGLGDRLERAVEAVESLRDSLLGTFDIHMGRAAQQANEVMKVLTILSAVLLPSVVLAGIMGMNFQVSIFDNGNNFWLVLAGMVGTGATIVGIARLRGWI